MVVTEFAKDSKRRFLLENYDFVAVTEADFKIIMDLCLDHFIKLEPHSRSKNFEKDESRVLFEYLVKKSLHYPYSCNVFEKKTGQLVATRLCSIGHRDSSLDWQPLEELQALSGMNEKITVFTQMLIRAKKRFWELAPKDMNMVLRREISCVIGEHQRKGIASYLADAFLDYDELKRIGVQAVISEAASIANQTLLESQGFVNLELFKDPVLTFELDDGTPGLKLMMKEIR